MMNLRCIFCAVMIRGRHRGLPVAIDKAIMLPSDKLIRAEEEDAQMGPNNEPQNSMTTADSSLKATK